ncbi:hypothetical protein Leryth_021730 [Lithospermum erythrorhizon]|nr:hypothetical protein Leryth_021730 [Lithospermum erythrorhizon]
MRGKALMSYCFFKRLIVPGVIGCLQALEAIKVASGIGEPLSGRLLLLDALSGRIRLHKIVRAAAGKSHTLVLSNDMVSHAFGWNKHGRLGIGSTRNGISTSKASSDDSLR